MWYVKVLCKGEGLYVADGAGVASLMGIQGTSMSTPITAGTAAILRQYFTDGYFPSGMSPIYAIYCLTLFKVLLDQTLSILPLLY